VGGGGVGVGVGRSISEDKLHPSVAPTRATSAIRIGASCFFPDFISFSFLFDGRGKEFQSSVPEVPSQSVQLGLEFLDPAPHTQNDLCPVQVHA
jgi:hypothetical protein